MNEHLEALAVVAVLAAAHLAAPALRFLRLRPRSAVLSAAAGISIAYVVVHLLPEIARAEQAVAETDSGLLPGLERQVWLLMLVGLVAFYGIERAAITSRGSRPNDEATTSSNVFWISIASFATYNALIAYSTVRRVEHDDGVDVALFALALGLHFIVNDLGLREHHRHRYNRFGRPILLSALLLGWLAAFAFDISEAAVGLIIAFLAGGIVLNVFKEELPEERESRFPPLALAAAGYAALLLLV